MCADMRLMQRRGVYYDIRTGKALSNEPAIGNRAYAISVAGCQYVQAEGLIAGRLQRAQQRFAKMSCTSGNQYLHRDYATRFNTVYDTTARNRKPMRS